MKIFLVSVIGPHGEQLSAEVEAPTSIDALQVVASRFSENFIGVRCVVRTLAHNTGLGVAPVGGPTDPSLPKAG